MQCQRCVSDGRGKGERAKGEKVSTRAERHGPTDAKELEQFLDKLFTEEMEKEHIPGAVFIFVKNGAVFFSKGYGFVDLKGLERSKW